ncbi:MAG TPA: penicillin-binding protein 1A [Xanthomonadaceae bacterium]|nr:penicillin-binding protein 1A [Xanthomonadaceae bacterium]
MRLLLRLLRLGLILGVLGLFLGTAALGVAYWLIAPQLPAVETLREVRLQQPLRVYSADGKLMATFGEIRRQPVVIADVPDQVRQAFIAIEDARFYEHPGIDLMGIARAVWLLATSDLARVPGGSTITQQVAKMFFLSPEYSYTRKLTEIFLALKIERELSKDEILELYLNKSFFGNRAYGVAAAADFYYGKSLDQLSLAEAAMLASIPKFPSTGNPLANPQRAMLRRNYVLERMAEVGFIDQASFRAAATERDFAHPHEPPIELEAHWVAEMVRLEAIERLGADAMQGGYVAHTTIDSRMQTAANEAVRAALLDYDRRHGYRGPEARVTLADDDGVNEWQRHLAGHRPVGGLMPALVVAVDEEAAELHLGDGQTVILPFEALSWARRYETENRRGPAPKSPLDVVAPGDIVRTARDAEGRWQFAQLPAVQGALVAIDPEDGALRAMVGGFSYAQSKFNRATQSQRQPGSSFKPFIYAAAFERGFTPASIVLDAPIVHNQAGMEVEWRPQNDNQSFAGPMRLREAMVTSRNLVSVRVLDAIGVPFAREYVSRFGLPESALPTNLSLALGSTAAPPIAMARGFAAFANGGFLVEPYLLDRLEDADGVVLLKSSPPRSCRECPERLMMESGRMATAANGSGRGDGDFGPPEVSLAPRIIDERIAFLIHSILKDVVRRGTGRGAMVLNRSDLGGKTGTTNDYRDAWFSGFGGGLVVSAWGGFDDYTSLGRGEFGSRVALPMWTDFMRVALDGAPEVEAVTPAGIVSASVDAESGRLVPAGRAGSILEMFRSEDLQRMELMQAGVPENDEESPYDIF